MISKIRIVGKMAVVTASPDSHPLHQLRLLTSELISLNFDGVVLFDLLAVNGLAPNRFVSLQFSGQKFDRSTFLVNSSVNSCLKSEQDSLLKKDYDFLRDSVLSSSEVAQISWLQ